MDGAPWLKAAHVVNPCTSLFSSLLPLFPHFIFFGFSFLLVSCPFPNFGSEKAVTLLSICWWASSA